MAQQITGSDGFQDFSSAATAIFGGESKEVMLPSLGRVVHIQPATMKQLPLVIGFFRDMLIGMDQEAVAGLVEIISDRQREAMQAGQGPNSVPVEEIASQALVGKAFKNVSLIAMLLSATLGCLPKVVPAFCDITADEFDLLPPDEGMLLAGGIFMVNYGFFTQSLPPLLTAFMKAWASKNLPAVIAHAPEKKVMRRR